MFASRSKWAAATGLALVGAAAAYHERDAVARLFNTTDDGDVGKMPSHQLLYLQWYSTAINCLKGAWFSTKSESRRKKTILVCYYLTPFLRSKNKKRSKRAIQSSW